MKLRTLLHRQGGCCFYCRKPLLEKEATIEHIIPNSMGDYQGFPNLVACCSLINSIFQDISPKHKIEILLNWGGRSPCPKNMDQSFENVNKTPNNLNSSFNEPLYGKRDKYNPMRDINEEFDLPDLPGNFDIKNKKSTK
jgi:hypothetical protein